MKPLKGFSRKLVEVSLCWVAWLGAGSRDWESLFWPIFFSTLVYDVMIASHRFGAFGMLSYSV